jgi:hypothetical protein
LVDNPASYKQVRNYPLMAVGVAIFGASWTCSAAFTPFAGYYMAVPIAGPLVLAGLVGSNSPGTTTLLVFDSLTQIAGVTMAIVGATTHRRVWNQRVAIAPLVGPDRAGVSLALRF